MLSTNTDINLNAFRDLDDRKLNELQNFDARQLDELVSQFDQWMQTQDGKELRKLPEEFYSILR